MKIKSFMTFSIVAILLTAVVTLSLSTSQSIFAQNINNNASIGMNTPNQNMMMPKGNQTVPLGVNYQNMDIGNKHATANGTINIFHTMYEAITSKFNVSLDQAINTAVLTTGNQAIALEAATDVNNGYIAYSIIVGTPDMKFYNVIVDPGNGRVLSSFQLSMMDGMMMMHSDMHKGNGMMMMHGWNNQDNGMTGMNNGFDKNGRNNNQGQW